MANCVINNMVCSCSELKKILKLYFSFLNEYKYLTEAYIIEYFTENHWQKLPRSWQELLQSFKPQDLADKLLRPTAAKPQTVWPLSLLAFKRVSHILTVPRSSQATPEWSGQDKSLDHIFRKHVNPKKQYEICVLSKVIKRIFEETECSSVIDVGAGQGHLSRLLSMGYNLPVTAVEREAKLLTMAKKFDRDAMLHKQKERKTNQKNDSLKNQRSSQEDTWIPPRPPHHVQCNISPDINHQDISSIVRDEDSPMLQKSVARTPSFILLQRILVFIPKLQGRPIVCSDSSISLYHLEQRYLLTGLHACGDLSATMIRIFKENSNIEAIVSVACCYMKLTTDQQEDEKVFSKAPSSEGHYCYPMSDYVKGLEHRELPYKSRELACHAIEDYIQRLQENGPHLRMHCYRALLERVLRRTHPKMKRPGVQTIKKAYLLPFAEYADRAFRKLKLPTPIIADDKIDTMLKEWSKVVVYFSLALMVAPAVESAILLDRIMYLCEHGMMRHFIFTRTVSLTSPWARNGPFRHTMPIDVHLQAHLLP